MIYFWKNYPNLEKQDEKDYQKPLKKKLTCIHILRQELIQLILLFIIKTDDVFKYCRQFVESQHWHVIVNDNRIQWLNIGKLLLLYLASWELFFAKNKIWTQFHIGRLLELIPN